ncbi:MAG: UDP-N-acetylmuramate dehydrogenase [Rhodospirillales bacterium]|nr:MAG: UDP-N-acetylmuramate dehydrogenase [Rhodospirillales bacterium]
MSATRDVIADTGVGGFNASSWAGSGLVRDLRRIVPTGVATDVPLRGISRWRIGGPADVLVRPRSIEDISRLREFLHRRRIPHVVIGSTSNLLFDDAGLRAVCIQIGEPLAHVTIAGTRMTVGSGAWVPCLARRAMQSGLSGVAHICGIPGTMGGLVCMNGGSQRQCIGTVVASVTSVGLTGEIHHRAGSACGFGYRQSIFQDNGEVIAEVVLDLGVAPDRDALRREMLQIMASRRRKFPQKQPNCGSVFKSNPAMYDQFGPPGAIIERLGFKGRRIGGARVSETHANFIVNDGDATARDVLQLIREIRRAVFAHSTHSMDVEVRFVSEEGHIVTPNREH